MLKSVVNDKNTACFFLFLFLFFLYSKVDQNTPPQI
jgi:hypothetical protein